MRIVRANANEDRLAEIVSSTALYCNCEIDFKVWYWGGTQGWHRCSDLLLLTPGTCRFCLSLLHLAPERWLRPQRESLLCPFPALRLTRSDLFKPPVLVWKAGIKQVNSDKCICRVRGTSSMARISPWGPSSQLHRRWLQ